MRARVQAGALLEGLDYDDAEDFREWLQLAREALGAAQRRALAGAADGLEAAGHFSGALALARLGVDVEPYAEEAHRRLVRLLYLSGDRSAALLAYERLKAMLQERFGVGPLPETAALAREISRGTAAATRAPAQPSAPKARLPLSVLRPPVLVGREQEWARMEAAWEARQGIAISGPPGVGKSRLVNDFLQAKAPGRTVFCSGKAGDRLVPYGTHARTYRQMLDVLGGAPLPEWARLELARIIPELGPRPPPLAGEEDKLRFWQAKIEPFRVAHGLGYDTLAFDDLQYVDAASAEAGSYVLSQLLQDPATPVRTIHVFRTGSLPPETDAIIRSMAAAGLLCLIELEPLQPSRLDELLASLGVPGLEGRAEELARYTGGNPLFVLETVRHLLESGDLSRGLSESLPPPGKVGPVIAERLAKLSAPALHLAQALAVLGTDFTLGVAAELLESPPLELAAPWRELETAQVVRGGGFSHDLMEETVGALMAEPVRRHLHRRAALVLQARGSRPARVAAHWRDAGEDAHAAPFLLAAAEQARGELLLKEAEDFYVRAAEALRAAGNEDGARAVLASRELALGGAKQRVHA
nr:MULTISPECIES: AAA family ATPase [Myxococcaceae]